jgi:hypothetical protein
MDDLSRDGPRKIAQQEDGGVCHLLRGHVAAQGSVTGKQVEHAAEVLDGARRDGGDRAGRDRVHADAVRPQVRRKVAHGTLEGGLRGPHDVVVGHHAPGAGVRHRDDAAAARHEAPRLAGRGDQGVRADVVGLRETAAAGLHETALKVFGRRPGDAVHHAVEDGHELGEFVDGASHGLVAAHVALDERGPAEFVGECLYAAPKTLGLVGERHGATVLLDSQGHRPGDGA